MTETIGFDEGAALVGDVQVPADAPLEERRAPDDPPLRPFGTRELPDFPIDALPRSAADWADAAAVQFQVPRDMPGMLSLAVLATTLAGKVEGEPRRGWREPSALYVVVAAEPGERKSAVFSAATRAIYQYQDERARDEATERRREADAFEAADLRLKTATRRLAETDDDEARTAYDAALATFSRTPTPRAPYRIVGDDVTPEKLVALLAEHDGRFALLSPEGGMLRTAIGTRYSKTGAPCFDVLLKAHAGDAISHDRKGGTVAVARPVLVLGLAVQPEILRELASERSARGVGLLARFLFVHPKSRVGSRDVRAAAMPDSIDAAWQSTIRELLNIPQGQEPTIVRFTPEADDRLAAFERDVEPRMAPSGDLYGVRDWAGKLAGAVVRLAVLLAYGDAASTFDVEQPSRIDVDHVERAVRIAEYLVPHAIAAFDAAVERDEVKVAKRIIGWIVRHERVEFSVRDAFIAMKGSTGSVGRVDEVQAALDVLESRGIVNPSQSHAIPQNSPRPGRSPSPRYRVVPDMGVLRDMGENL
jgi:hypothetical protein